MDEASITRYIAETFAGVDVVRPGPDSEPAIARGDTFFIYDPDRNLEANRRLPFATIVTKDYGDFDRASNLDRPGVFRLNIGISKETYGSLFGPRPHRHGADGAADTVHDFAALDRLMPHPVYAPQSWVCVLNPSDATFEAVRPLLAEAHDLAVRRFLRARRAEGS
jgi:hypothetical protein